MYECAKCRTTTCGEGKDCARGYEFSSYVEKAKKEYEKENIRKIWENASKIEAEHYMKWIRLEEIKEFCHLMEYKKIGVVMCSGLIEEASMVVKFLSEHLEVASICCKNCSIDKKHYDFPQIKKNKFEAACNPIGQALVMNDEKTELNIIIGLCIGHDILFTKYSKAPVTTFIVKDRVLGHNTVASIYSNYYKNKLALK